MTENIIDKTMFFKRRMRPTDDDLKRKADDLCDQIITLFSIFWREDFSPEQRVRILHRISDFVCSEIMVGKGQGTD